MKSIIFDTGPIISLTTNNLLWILGRFKKRSNVDFYITPSVNRELVDVPLETKRFKFEALQVMHCIKNGIIKVVDDGAIKQRTLELLDLANNSFQAHGNWIRVVHYAEMAGVAAYIEFKGDALVVDERTTRVLIENPNKQVMILRNKLNADITVNKVNLNKFSELTKNIKIIRSCELVTIAYELGLLNEFLPDMPNSKETLLESILWGVKLNGCSISLKEIEQIIRMERK